MRLLLPMSGINIALFVIATLTWTARSCNYYVIMTRDLHQSLDDFPILETRAVAVGRSSNNRPAMKLATTQQNHNQELPGSFESETKKEDMTGSLKKTAGSSDPVQGTGQRISGASNNRRSGKLGRSSIPTLTTIKRVPGFPVPSNSRKGRSSGRNPTMASPEKPTPWWAGRQIAMGVQRKSKKYPSHSPMDRARASVVDSMGPTDVRLSDQDTHSSAPWEYIQPKWHFMGSRFSFQQVGVEAYTKTASSDALLNARACRVNVRAWTGEGNIEVLCSGPGYKPIVANIPAGQRIATQFRGRPGRPVTVQLDLRGEAVAKVNASTFTGDAYHTAIHPSNIRNMENVSYPRRRLQWSSEKTPVPPAPRSKLRAAAAAAAAKSAGQETSQSMIIRPADDAENLADEMKNKLKIDENPEKQG